MKPKKLLFIGDSLIEFYDWQKRFPDHDVFNLGIAGETVEGLCSRLDTVFKQIDIPDYIFIMTGLNNLAMDDRDVVRTYRKIVISLVKHYPSSQLYIHSLLPVLFPWITNDDIRETNKGLRKMAEEEKVYYCNLHSMFLDAEGKPVASYLADDGVHLSPEGYRVWSDEVEQLIHNAH